VFCVFEVILKGLDTVELRDRRRRILKKCLCSFTSRSSRFDRTIETNLAYSTRNVFKIVSVESAVRVGDMFIVRYSPIFLWSSVPCDIKISIF
jgi:hypothetical protein